jgi:hypothetical protein
MYPDRKFPVLICPYLMCTPPLKNTYTLTQLFMKNNIPTQHGKELVLEQKGINIGFDNLVSTIS